VIALFVALYRRANVALFFALFKRATKRAIAFSRFHKERQKRDRSFKMSERAKLSDFPVLLRAYQFTMTPNQQTPMCAYTSLKSHFS